jgi:hypothetical protein
MIEINFALVIFCPPQFMATTDESDLLETVIQVFSIWWTEGLAYINHKEESKVIKG